MPYILSSENVATTGQWPRSWRSSAAIGRTLDATEAVQWPVCYGAVAAIVGLGRACSCALRTKAAASPGKPILVWTLSGLARWCSPASR
jgi:hypothetical protein